MGIFLISGDSMFRTHYHVLRWYLTGGDIAATPATDASRRLGRLVKPKIASTLTRATSQRQMAALYLQVAATSPFPFTSRVVATTLPTGRGDVADRSSLGCGNLTV